MLRYALRKGDRRDIDILNPAGFFVDGTNPLWEDKRPEAAGNYVNTYDNVGVEGTCTFRFYVHGRLPDGGEFSQVMTHSVWVSVRTDPSASTVATSQLGRNQIQVTITPRDAGGQYLGPFWPTSIDFHTTTGHWVGNVVDRYDGSARRPHRLAPAPLQEDRAPAASPLRSEDGVDAGPLAAREVDLSGRDASTEVRARRGFRA